MPCFVRYEATLFAYRMTSRVLRVFHEIKESLWDEDLYITKDTMDKTATWLAQQYDPDTGAFWETDPVMHDRNINVNKFYSIKYKYLLGVVFKNIR